MNNNNSTVMFNPFRVGRCGWHDVSVGYNPRLFIFNPSRVNILSFKSLKGLNVNNPGCNPGLNIPFLYNPESPPGHAFRTGVEHGLLTVYW